MLTRAYDAIMASFQVPMITYENVDFNTSVIDDSVLNCKDGNGVIRSILSPSYINNISGNVNVLSVYVSYIPFSVFSNSSRLIPDEDSSDPNYEDYSCSTSPSGWSFSSTSYPIKKTYDESTKEYNVVATPVDADIANYFEYLLTFVWQVASYILEA